MSEKISNTCIIIATTCCVIITGLFYLYVREVAFSAYGKAFTWGTVFNTDKNPHVTPGSLKQ